MEPAAAAGRGVGAGGALEADEHGAATDHGDPAAARPGRGAGGTARTSDAARRARSGTRRGWRVAPRAAPRRGGRRRRPAWARRRPRAQQVAHAALLRVELLAVELTTHRGHASQGGSGRRSLKGTRGNGGWDAGCGLRFPRLQDLGSASRPREQRDFTVPTATPSTWAASATGRRTCRRGRGPRAAPRAGARGPRDVELGLDVGRGVLDDGERRAGADTVLPGPTSSSSGRVGRTARRGARSRQALTTMRCSQVVTAESPRKRSAARRADTRASWTASAASSRSPVVRRATAHSRSRWRRTTSPKASGSPATCAATSSASVRGSWAPAAVTRRVCR